MGVNCTTPDATCPECGHTQELRPVVTGGWIRLDTQAVPASAVSDEGLRWYVTADGFAVAGGQGNGGDCYLEHRQVCSRRRHPAHLDPIFTAVWACNRGRDGLHVED
ncbi:DUF6083 domain-containing protein [Streptomyces sp. URMC 127]|uniref:DUF6083 domain-containing protein n=1 Tax=Streptomyces sp. URMC 127 TaxID=3423402 RepID=UPI003F1C196A